MGWVGMKLTLSVKSVVEQNSDDDINYLIGELNLFLFNYI